MKRAFYLILMFCAGLAIGYVAFNSPPQHKADTLDGRPQVAAEKWDMFEPKANDPYREALKKSKAENRPIFLFFSMKTCGPCNKMKAETFVDANVKSRLDRYIWVEVDGPVRKDLAEKWSVEGYPTYIFIDYKEQPLKRASGFLDAGQFLDWLGSY